MASLATFLGIPAGISLSLICIPLALSGPSDGITGPVAVFGLLLLASSTALSLFWPRLLSDKWKSFQESGDYDVWPFIRRKDFDLARQTCHVFAK